MTPLDKFGKLCVCISKTLVKGKISHFIFYFYVYFFEIEDLNQRQNEYQKEKNTSSPRRGGTSRVQNIAT